MRKVGTQIVTPNTDIRSYNDFIGEICAIRDQPLVVQLAFMRNRKNRDRAMSLSADKLRRILLG